MQPSADAPPYRRAAAAGVRWTQSGVARYMGYYLGKLMGYYLGKIFER